jgi:hypothetical protein
VTAPALVAPAVDAYCVDPAGDAWLRHRVEAAVGFLLDAIGARDVEGLILTGSLARGEASVVVEPDGCRLLGDVEFLLIVRPRKQWREFRRGVTEIGRHASERIGDGSRFAVEYTPADASYLAERAQPSTFTFDLRQHGRVLFGNTGLIATIPAFERADIPATDAIETLMNRGIEWLALESTEGHEGSEYAVVKTLLDMAGSALAFAGIYESRYADRPSALRSLLSERPDLANAIREPGSWLAAVESAAEVKLRPTGAGLRALGAAVQADTLRRWLVDLWRWELGSLLGRRNTSVSELVTGYLLADRPAERLRGWAKYVWHPLRPASAPLTPRLARLAITAGPRRLVYAAAVLALHGAPGWQEDAARLLPTSAKLATEADIRRSIVEAWTWLIRNN